MSLKPGLQKVMAGNSISWMGIPVEEIVVRTCYVVVYKTLKKPIKCYCRSNMYF